MKKPKVLFCDMDGTLIQTRSGKTFAQGIWDMELRLDILEKIREIEPEYLLIVTNQGGIGQFFTKQDFEIKLSYIEISIRDFIKHSNLKAVDSKYCPSMNKDDYYRKPNVGMLAYFAKQYDLLSKYSKKDMLMIGDASGKKGQFSDTDYRTALNYGIDYLDVDDMLFESFI